MFVCVFVTIDTVFVVRFCNIPVSLSTFKDPCPGVTKRLNVQVRCA